jgi:glyoxylase-like metal-dependent hydrolase (beta-lactamase superfamily II)
LAQLRAGTATGARLTRTGIRVEVAPGIHRIESVLGPRPFSQYLLRGERTLLVDTGVKETPGEVILPFLERAGIEPSEIDLVLVSHADVDHFGGNAAIAAAAPRALVCAHAADIPWIQSSERILRERYGWYEGYGVPYPPGVLDWMRDAMGPDTPVDLQLQGGERIRLGPELTVEVLHLPGHSAGHLGLWEPVSRTAIVQDAVMANGLLDTDGNVIHPPPVPYVAGYERSATLVKELRPARLLTAHYDVIEGPDVDRFLDDSIEFVRRARMTVKRALAAEPGIALRDLLAAGDAELGPFTSMPNELAATLRGVLDEQGVEAR